MHQLGWGQHGLARGMFRHGLLGGSLLRGPHEGVGYLAGRTGSSSAPGRWIPHWHNSIPVTHSRTPRSPRAVPSRPPAKTLGETEAEPSQGILPRGRRGHPRPPTPPKKAGGGQLTAHHEGQHQGGRQGPEDEAGMVGGSCEDTRPPRVKTPLGVLYTGSCGQGKEYEKKGGARELLCVSHPSPESPKQGVLGQSTLVRPPKTLQTPLHKGVTPVRDQQQKLGVPKDPSAPPFGVTAETHSLAETGRQPARGV